MDTRVELQKNDILRFPGMECVIETAVGRGSNVIAYTGRYADHLDPKLSHRVLIRELFPYDRKGGIRREADGSIATDDAARSLYAMNLDTFRRGVEVHLRLLEKLPGRIDLNINTFEANHTLYSLLGFTGGRTLEEELNTAFRVSGTGKGGEAGTAALLHMIRILRGALSVLQAFHDAGYLHLDISPDNILLIGRGEEERITLIDYNSVHTKEEILAGSAVYFSTKEGYTAPEVRMGRVRQIRECTDLYSMTAVFYRCLTGRRPGTEQIIGTVDPCIEVMRSPFLEGCPETALSMLRQIIRKGLSVTPRRRFQKTEHMLADLTELEDRILRRGITRWALWEAGRDSLRRMMSLNTALHYICEAKNIYPLYAETEDESRVLLTGNEGIRASAHRPLLLLGGGGMGKTTALLRMAYEQDGHYTPRSTAVFYISLYGYRSGEEYYISNRLLDSLKFKEHTDSRESARHELRRLLDSPLLSLSLLLDGLNEASGDTAPLLREIHEFAALAGVRIILTSRSDPGDPLFSTLSLCRLEHARIREILAQKGVLPPENMEVFDLLSFPIMLSMYIRTVLDGERQLRLDSRKQLLDDYFQAILEKEKRSLPQDHPLTIGCDAAVHYLLPEIAALAEKQKRALSGEELQKLVEKCYPELSGRAITAVRPEWIGHVSELRLGAKTADEWFGRAVRELLWKRLGLLVRDERGDFRVIHQMIGEYLAEKSRSFHEQFDRVKTRQRNWKIAVGLVIALVFSSWFAIFNYNRNIRLERQKQEILRDESIALAYSSEAKLKGGDRRGAVSDALAALPSEGNERPYVAAAEKCLTEALYVYEDGKYHPYNLIHSENAVTDHALSDDGKYYVCLEKYGQLTCYEAASGSILWKKQMPHDDISDVEYMYSQTTGTYERITPEASLPFLRVLNRQKAVLYAGGSGDAALFSLETGEVLWRIPGDMAEANKYAPVKYAAVSDDEETLVIAVLFQVRDELIDDDYEYYDQPSEAAGYYEYLSMFDYNRILYFYDIGTGILKKKSEPLPVPSGFDCLYSGTGTFAEENTAYISSFFDLRTEEEFLVKTDIQSGESELLNTIDRNWNNYNASQIAGLTWIDDTDRETGARTRGVLRYFCQYETGGSSGISGEIYMGFYSFEDAKWLYYKKYEPGGDLYRLPDIRFLRGSFYFAAGNRIRRLFKDGTEEVSYLEKRAVFSAEDQETGNIFLAFEDGTAGIFDPGSMALTGDTAKTYPMTNVSLRSSEGSRLIGHPFCAISEEDAKTTVLFRYFEIDKKRLEEALPDDTAWEYPLSAHYREEEGIYVLPGGEGFVQLDYLYAYGIETREDEKYFAAVYDQDGSLKESWSRSGSGIGSRVALSSEGVELYWDKIVLNNPGNGTSWPEHDGTWSNIYTSATQEGILSAYWKNGSLYLSVDHGEESVLQPPPEGGSGRLADVEFRRSYSPAFDFRNLVIGNNGLVILLCCDSEKTEINDTVGYTTDLFQVYSRRENRWVQIRNASAGHGFPIVAAAQTRPLFASLDESGSLFLYDAGKAAASEGNVIGEWKGKADFMSVSDIQFIMDDEYLMVQSRSGGHQIQIIRCSDGELVFSCTAGTVENDHYSHLIAQYFREKNRLFLIDEYCRLDSFCIDPETWTRLFTVPDLRCVLNNGTFIIKDPSDTSPSQCTAYDLNALIEKGNAELGVDP